MVDVTVSAIIDAEPERVAAVMFEPSNDPKWIGGALSAVALTSGPYGQGTRVRREGGFLGRKFSWITEIATFEPQRAARMIYVAGPFKGGVDYMIAPVEGGSEVTIRNYGQASFWMPFMGAMMRASVSGDLKRLKALVEAS